MKKRVTAYAFVVLSLLVFFGTLYMVTEQLESEQRAGITGKSLQGVVRILVNQPDLFIEIFSPENKTYFFSVSEDFEIDLNVSAGFEADTWWYDLYDLRHKMIIETGVIFDPNTTFEAVRWDNRMTVFANNSLGEVGQKSVVFHVSVPNSAPIIGHIDDPILVCESDSLSYWFNVTEKDGGELVVDVHPKNPFFVNPTNFDMFNRTVIESELFSSILGKDLLGEHGLEISATDGQYVDHATTVVDVIEINNPPVMQNIGVQTVWTEGENSTFFKELQVNDQEDGTQDQGNLNFSIEFFSDFDLFNISDFGIMNFSIENINYSNEEYDSIEDIIGVHDIGVCVTDQGIQNIHQNISFCGQDGSPITVCQNFSLTITDENRPPTIVDHYPSNLTMVVDGGEEIYFNITKFDPDGTIPDAYWYIDNELKQFDSGSEVDEFTTVFDCEFQGLRTVRSEITDGELNDSVQWEILVNFVDCPVPPPESPSSGVGGVGEPLCAEKWACSDWRPCQNAQRSLDIGSLSGDVYRDILAECRNNNWDETSCGYQLRSCIDFNNCNTSRNEPDAIQACFFTQEPSCNDGIRNCHSGGCEVLIDCGGPCGPCPTCSDGIQNQGEEGVDCGGPCPWSCPPERPVVESAIFQIGLFLLLFILLIITLIKLVRVIYLRSQIKDK